MQFQEQIAQYCSIKNYIKGAHRRHQIKACTLAYAQFTSTEQPPSLEILR